MKMEDIKNVSGIIDNNENETMEEVWMSYHIDSLDRILAWLMMLATPLISVVGIIGNGLVLMLIAFTPRLRHFRAHYFLTAAILSSTIMLLSILLICIDWWFFGRVLYGDRLGIFIVFT